MYRLAFRNRGGVESLLVNQSVDPDGAGTRSAAVRWYEVRNPFGNPADADTTKRPVIFQSGTYDPGSTGGSYTVTPSKTTNVNGITAFDATLVLRHVAAGGVGPNALSANQQLAADADGASGVTSFDATVILRYVAANGANATTGQTGNWKFSPASRSYSLLTTSPGAENYSAILIGEVSGDWIP